MSDVQTMTRKVDVSKGEMRHELSREWARRPDDQRFLSLQELLTFVRARSERSIESVVALRDLRFDGMLEDDRLAVLTNDEYPLEFSNWSFGQLCRSIAAPAGYLQTLPVNLAAACLQSSAILNGDGDCKELIDSESWQLRALTGPKYGRIADADVIEQITKLAEASDVQWKVPGMMDWSTHSYNPNVPVTKDSTTLFASDRDCAVFLCDDLNPIEVGKLAGGEPDLMFRGIFVRNSEVGYAKLEVMTMYLRGVCANRCLWGVEGFKTIDIRHTEWAPERFRDEILPTLDSYHRADAARLVSGVKAAKETTIVTATSIEDKRDDQRKFLIDDLGFTKKAAEAILVHEAPGTDDLVTAWDFSQKLTSYAQTLPYQDKRLDIEMAAGKLLDRVSA